MGNTNSTKPERQPPPPSPVLAAEESYESAKESFESAEAMEWEISNFTCEICAERMLSRNNKFTNKGLCAHPFCVDCITKYIQVKVEHDHVAEIKCPGLNCDQLLDPFTCQTFIPPQLFTKWCDVMCQRAVSGLERKCYCPNRECSEVVVNECGGNVKKSKCPNCKRLFCFSCGVKWHAGFSCEESGKMRRDRNDVAFGVLAEKKKWMRCPGCKHFVERVGGCRFVMCRCWISFCYECGRKVHGLFHSCDPNYTWWRDSFVWLCVVIFISLLYLVVVLILARFGQEQC